MALDHGRIDQVKIALRSGRSILVDQMKRSSEKRLDMFGRIANGGGRADKLRLAAMHLADSEKPSEYIRNVGTKCPAVGVNFIDHDITQA